MAVLELRNENLTVLINTLGAELMNVKGARSTEFLWNGDASVWPYRAPVLFPICGDLNDGKYEYDGKVYPMKRHGFARDMEFTAETSPKEVCASFVLESDDETLAVYPFAFRLRITYELCGSSLKVSYAVENRTDGDMYFSIGSHEGYACPEGIEEYDVCFEEELGPKESQSVDEVNSSCKSGKIALRYEYFTGKTDTIVYKDIRFKKVILNHRNGSKSVVVEPGDAKSFMIWTKPEAKFICLEPWHGIPEVLGADPDITKKPGIVRLKKGKTFKTSHTITFYE